MCLCLRVGSLSITKSSEKPPRCFSDLPFITFAAVEEVAIFHIGRKCSCKEIDGKNHVLVGLPTSDPSDVELFLTYLRSKIVRRQHGNHLSTPVKTFKD